MRVLKSAQLSEEHHATALAEPAPALLSLRAVTLLEVVSVIFTVLITAWAIVPLRLNNRWLEMLPALLALALMINSHRLRGERPGELGFTTRHFWRALRLLVIPTIGAVGIIALIGYSVGSLKFTSHFLASVVGRSAWGLVQQYMLQAFIYRRLRSAMVNQGANEGAAETQHSAPVWLPIIIAASLFALVHAPNLPLMLLTLVSALLWTRTYERAPNLFALALSHGLMSAVTAAALPDWMINGMVVGLRHLVYQSF